MVIIKNNILPFKNYLAMAIWPFVFVRKDKEDKWTPRKARHELIHFHQQREMLMIFFFVWYRTEWLIRLLKYRNSDKAYRNISFEREAYSHENDINYIENRRFWAWLKYL